MKSLRMNARLFAAVISILLISASDLWAQTTIHVPSDQSTIQAAIDASQDGDTVLVSAGTYYENINFHGKAITLTSVSGPASTIIDGGAKATVVTFNSGEGPKSVLNGFTIQNGSGYFGSSYGSGGGVEVDTSSPTITNNIITNNRAIAGIGIDVHRGSPLIKNNIITGNAQAGGSGGGGGGGIQTAGDYTISASPTIVGNTITNNSVLGGGNGGGIIVSYFGRPLIQNNLIRGNTVYNYGGGIAIENYDGAVVTQNVIVANSSGIGGGIAIIGGPTSNILNNTIIGNTGSDLTSGIYASREDHTTTVANNIVIASLNQTAVVCDLTGNAFSPVFSHNDFFSPAGMTSSGGCDLSGVPGNISVDPLFANPSAGDFHLQPLSPAIDAGDNSILNLPQKDFEANTRIVDGNNNCVATIDLGAYELQTTVQSTFNPTSLTFPDQTVGTTGSLSYSVLSNTGSTCMPIVGFNISSPDFAQTNTCGSALQAGTSCTVAVSFQPQAVGLRSGTLAVSSSSTGAPSLRLSGVGVVPVANISPTTLSFASQVLNTASAAQPVMISNTGGGTLHISAIPITGDFLQASSSCGSTVASGGSCTVYVAFKPSVLGTRTGTLTLSSDSSTSTPTVTFSGTGVTGSPSLAPTSISFGNVVVGGKASSQTVTLKATGPGPLTISSITIAPGFSQSNKCPSILNAGSSCSISVSFKPTVVGTVTGFLSVTDNGYGSPQSVSLSGTGVKKH